VTCQDESVEAVPAWWVISEKLHSYWPSYTQDVFDVTECCTRSDSCQSLMMSVSQSTASSSSVALVSCPSALPARCWHFTASRCRWPPLWSLAVQSHSLITASTLALLADFVRRLSCTASAQQHNSLLPITDNYLLTVSCPLNNYWHGYCGIVSAKDLVSPTSTLEVSFLILLVWNKNTKCTQINLCTVKWAQCDKTQCRKL